MNSRNREYTVSCCHATPAAEFTMTVVAGSKFQALWIAYDRISQKFGPRSGYYMDLSDVRKAGR